MNDRTGSSSESYATGPPPRVGARFNPHHEICGFYAPDVVDRQPDLTDGQKRLYQRAVRWAGRNGRFWYGFETMAKELGKSSRQVKRDIEAQERLRLIEHDRRGKRQTNMYYFLLHSMFEGEVTPASHHQRGEVTLAG